MTSALDRNSRVEISGFIELSEDRRTIIKALRIDGVWYDIEIDSPPRSSLESYKSMVPKIQLIWARIAEQALPPNPLSKLKMECSYNCTTERASVFTISNRGKEDITDSISFDVQELKDELGESPETVNNYFGNGNRCTVHAVMKYVSCELMKPSSILRSANEELTASADFFASAPTTPRVTRQKENLMPASTPRYSRPPPPLLMQTDDEFLPAPTPRSEQALKPTILASAPNFHLAALRESVQRVIQTARRVESSLVA